MIQFNKKKKLRKLKIFLFTLLYDRFVISVAICFGCIVNFMYMIFACVTYCTVFCVGMSIALVTSFSLLRNMFCFRYTDSFLYNSLQLYGQSRFM